VSARQRRNDQPHDDPVPSGRAQRGAPPNQCTSTMNLSAVRRASTPLEGTGRRARSARRTRGGTRGKFVRLQRDLGVNAEGAALIVELLDRIDALEQRLRHLEGR
jgi:hypothetical protein